MKKKLSFVICIFFCSMNTFCIPIVQHSLNGHKLDTIIIKKTRIWDIKFSQIKSSYDFESIIKSRKIIVNDSSIYDLDSICYESNLFTESFAIDSTFFHLIRETEEIINFTIGLSQEGCNGSFCYDIILLFIKIDNSGLSYNIVELGPPELK